MAHFVQVNNERSETIELIKLMDHVAKQNTWQIKSVGGESTLNTGTQHMFPDVFLYGDTTRTQVLQGWEVKMPDVPITDAAFIADAQRKADVLGVNSCFVWNFTHGVLYVKQREQWVIFKEWNQTSHIRTRDDVKSHKKDWEGLIELILIDINNYFLTGDLRSSKIGDMLSGSVFTEIIKRNKNITAENLRSASFRNTTITAYISQWWIHVSREYRFDENDMYVAYAQIVLLNWINKFTFANMIKHNHNPATAVERIDENVSTVNALKIFEDITSQCDFFNVFNTMLFSEILPAATWVDLTDYNAFLVENGLVSIPQETLQSVLEGSVNQFKRNVAGLFTTPQKLAKVLVNAGITDLTVPVIDPCCGTGTIVKEIIEAKSIISTEAAYGSSFASDKYTLPLQVSNIAMTRTNAINLPCYLFQANAFDLNEGQIVEIIDPRNGERKHVSLPRFGSLVSNLPFVAFDQEGREESDHINGVINRVRVESGIVLSGRADLYQALLLDLRNILADNASVAVITSNSWLGTLAGRSFFRVLNFYYSVDCIIASGKGKWFSNADVITLMLFIKKKTLPCNPPKTHAVFFGLTRKSLPEWSEDDMTQIINLIRLRQAVSSRILSIREYSLEQINKLLGMNVAINSMFYNINWLLHLRDILCPVTELFNVFRGMKTAQNAFYYLQNAGDVEPMYVGNVFKSAKSCLNLTSQPDAYSFICDKTITELSALGHVRALNRINQFRGHLNKSVQNKETFWMNIANGTFAGSDSVRLFTGMNPERRIFYGLLNTPAQIDQRAIGFKPIEESLNLELCHALLNSVLGVFYTEATGFPKGLAALDNCAENVKKIMMLDPRRLTTDEVRRILDSFSPLLARNIKTTEEEYRQADRLAYEQTVAEIFGYSAIFDDVLDCIMEMQRVRLSV